MKTNLLPLAALMLAFILVSGCKKNKVDPTTEGFSVEIQKIVPQSLVDDLRVKGMTINEGQQPPSVEGIYRADPFELLSPYAPEDSYEKGRIISPQLYKFTGQSADKSKVQIEYKSEGGTDSGAGVGSFVAGTGNKFTIFAQVEGRANSVDYTRLVVISGEINCQRNRQFSVYPLHYQKERSRGIRREIDSCQHRPDLVR